MTLKEDAKFKGKLTRGLEKDINHSINFMRAVENLEKLHFDGSLLSKACKILDEKVQKSYVS